MNNKVAIFFTRPLQNDDEIAPLSENDKAIYLGEQNLTLGKKSQIFRDISRGLRKKEGTSVNAHRLTEVK